jgi:hypothetical protein
MACCCLRKKRSFVARQPRALKCEDVLLNQLLDVTHDNFHVL